MSNQGPSTISCTVDHPKDWPCAICTPTPSDSAMTADRLAQRLDKWSHFASFGDAYQAEAREIAAFVRALEAERTKLAADLARLEEALRKIDEFDYDDSVTNYREIARNALTLPRSQNREREESSRHKCPASTGTGMV